jgi:hypothetical protein
MSYNRRLIRLVHSRAPVDDRRERSDIPSDNRRAMIIPVHTSYNTITTIHHNLIVLNDDPGKNIWRRWSNPSGRSERGSATRSSMATSLELLRHECLRFMAETSDKEGLTPVIS